MTEKTTTYLNLDAIVPVNEVVVKLGGVEHKLVPITLEDFARNQQAVQALAEKPASTQDEMNMIRDMLGRAFPTMTPEVLNKVTLLQLNTLLDFAMKHNGSKQVEEEASGDAAANPNPAGQ